MLPKSERLTKEDFTTSRTKIVYRGELFDVATITPSRGKFACVIAKKTLKKAVDRNTVKRRFMSALVEYSTLNNISMVIYPKKNSLTVPYSHIKEEIKKVFATLH